MFSTLTKNSFSRYLSMGMALVLCAVVLTGCSLKDKEGDDLATSMPNPAIAEMVAKYQALEYTGDFDYSYQRQAALLNQGKRIVFEGFIEDIWTNQGRTFISFMNYLDPAVFILESKMSINDLETLVGLNDEEPTQHFVVVAQITSTTKPSTEVNGDVEEDYVDITSSAGETIIARGELINLVSNENTEEDPLGIL